MPPASRIGACIALLAALALPASGQGTHVFHPERDLPGFEAAGLSEWSELYALDSFKSSEGKELSAAEFEALRARWDSEQVRAGKRIAEIQADPRERWIWQFGKKLARHSYFSKIAYTIERPEPGYVIVLQRPAKDEPGYATRIASFYMPFVKKMAANFDELVAKPAGLQRRDDQPVTAFAVLASKGDLDNYERFLTDPSGYTSGTAYDYQLQLAVTYEEPFAGMSLVAQRANLLYELAKELQHAHLAVPGNRPGSIWMYEGLAFLLAMHEGSTPDSLDKHAVRANSSASIVDLLAKTPARELLLLPVDELAQLRSWDQYARGVAAHAKRLQVDAPDEVEVGEAYYAQCELWTHYLLDGAQSIYRKPYAEFQKAAFRGKGDGEDLRHAFAGTDLRVLSRDFLLWTCAEFERTHAGQKVDRTPIQALFPAKESGEAPVSNPAVETARAAPLVDPAFSPRMIAPAEDDVEAEFALALSEARGGDISGARDALRSLCVPTLAAPWPERIAREIGRMEELAKLRDGYLAYLKSSASKLAFKHNGKDVLAPVSSIEGGIVHLGENKLGLPSIALSEIDPYEVAKLAAKKEMQGGAQPWARFYAYVLAGDARWEKLLKDDSAAAHELRGDAKEVPELLHTAALARELFELSKLPLPSTEADARARLERIKVLIAGQSASNLLKRSLVPLRQLATACLEQTRTAGDAAGLLHAKSEPLPEGRTRLTWEFDAPDEAEDWIRQVGYLKSWRDLFPKLATSEADSHFTVQKGHLSCTGQVCYRSAANFSGPITVRLRYRHVSMEAEHGPPYFCVLLCDDGDGSYIVTGDSGFVRVRDLKQHYERESHSAEQHPYFLDQDVEFEIVHDGKDVATTFDKQALAKAGCGPRKSGNVVLFAHMDTVVSIDRIVIEGQISPSSLRELESRWFSEQLSALGFP